MKTRITTLVVGMLLAFSVSVSAYTLPSNFQNWFFGATTCSSLTPNTPAPLANQALCLDATSGAIYVWNGSSFVTSIQGSTPTVTSLTVSGSGSGAAVIVAPAAAGTPTLTLPTANGTFVTNASTGVYRSNHSGSSNAVVSNSAANFIPFDGVAAPQATNEGDVSTIVADVEIVKNLKCVLTTAAGVVTAAGGTNYVVALDQNLSASIVTCTIATAATSCTDTTHTITTAIGDQLDYLVTPSGTPTALVVKCSAETVI